MTYQLPEIKGVSEKQINYATNLRNRYIATFAKSVEEAANLLSKVDPTARKAGAEKQGVSEEQFVKMAMEAYCLDIEYFILTNTEASTIIDTLKSRA